MAFTRMASVCVVAMYPADAVDLNIVLAHSQAHVLGEQLQTTLGEA